MAKVQRSTHTQCVVVVVCRSDLYISLDLENNRAPALVQVEDSSVARPFCPTLGILASPHCPQSTMSRPPPHPSILRCFDRPSGFLNSFLGTCTSSKENIKIAAMHRFTLLCIDFHGKVCDSDNSVELY